jgi:hypothetical protein
MVVHQDLLLPDLGQPIGDNPQGHIRGTASLTGAVGCRMISATFQFGPAPFGCSRLIVTSWISLPPTVRLAIFKHSASSEPCFWFASVAVFFFAAWTKGWETWECDEFPRARTSFERALHFKTTCFASVGDILKAVDKENRHDLRY